ncbi:NAD(P)-dependent oxidoreductase [Streptomyces sp. LaPpAH-108]|uniref:NAD(P)-dependent oxidoreductase n=1 Tax=Streptomyces sp. LaPpAH-108 TaxID=1155714 RepID=UPI000370B3F3|nr:NAD(P)H-binding protein [Streptomyces sp. LaPpAH-108]
MSGVIVFGAGGRIGRAAVDEALRRGYDVTAVVRNPDRHGDLRVAGARLRGGDVTDPGSVAHLAAGHDAAIHAAYDAGSPPDVFFPAAARALVKGLAQAGVGRLVAVGLSALLETPDGTRLLDTPVFPAHHRSFALAHAAGAAVLHDTSAAPPDWLIVSPAGDFAPDSPRSGGYRLSLADPTTSLTPEDFALALLDEIDTPSRHRVQIGVAPQGN